MAYGKNAPFGLKPYASRLGGPWVPQLNKYKIAATADGQITYSGSSLFTGDPVFWNGAAINNQAGTIADYTHSVVGTMPIGVFQGCEYYDVNNIFQTKSCWIAGTRVYPGTSITALVIDDPFVIWDIQVSTVTNNINDTVANQSWIGDNAKLAVGNPGPINPPNPASGNTNTGVSAYYLDGSSDGTALSAFLKIIDFTPHPQNYQTIGAADGQGNTFNTRPFLNMLVMFNSHYFKSTGTPGTEEA